MPQNLSLDEKAKHQFYIQKADDKVCINVIVT